MSPCHSTLMMDTHFWERSIWAAISPWISLTIRDLIGLSSKVAHAKTAWATPTTHASPSEILFKFHRTTKREFMAQIRSKDMNIKIQSALIRIDAPVLKISTSSWSSIRKKISRRIAMEYLVYHETTQSTHYRMLKTLQGHFSLKLLYRLAL